jgi:hypothetical protein
VLLENSPLCYSLAGLRSNLALTIMKKPGVLFFSSSTVPRAAAVATWCAAVLGTPALAQTEPSLTMGRDAALRYLEDVANISPVIDNLVSSAFNGQHAVVTAWQVDALAWGHHSCLPRQGCSRRSTQNDRCVDCR